VRAAFGGDAFVLGLGQDFDSTLQKPLWTENFLRRTNGGGGASPNEGEEIILFVDGYDSVVLCPADEIALAFAAIERDVFRDSVRDGHGRTKGGSTPEDFNLIVFSAEAACNYMVCARDSAPFEALFAEQQRRGFARRIAVPSRVRTTGPFARGELSRGDAAGPASAASKGPSTPTSLVVETLPKFQFLNSGGYVGRRRAVLAMLSALNVRAQPVWDNDQRLITALFAELIRRRSEGKDTPVHIHLDYRSQIFQTLGHTSADDFAVETPPGTAGLARVRSRLTGERPCVLHGNGKTGKGVLERLSTSLGLGR
jgi:hypothetical protein